MLIKKEKMEPLLYIVQPKLEKPEAVMQTSVFKKISQTEPEEKSSRQMTQEEIYQKRKELPQMSLHEKIDFFSNLPGHVYKNVCRIETKEKTYEGIILSKEQETVDIRSFDSSEPIRLKLEEITEIKVLG